MLCPLLKTHSSSWGTYQFINYLHLSSESFFNTGLNWREPLHPRSCPLSGNDPHLMTTPCSRRRPSPPCLFVVHLHRLIPAPVGLAEALLRIVLTLSFLLCPFLLPSLSPSCWPKEHIPINVHTHSYLSVCFLENSTTRFLPMWCPTKII